MQKTLQGLRKEHTALLSSSTSGSSELERVKLQLEGTKTSLAELQQKHAEQEGAKEELVRQLEKWRTLEAREGEELGDLRKRKIELEVEVQELHSAAEERELKFKTKLLRFKQSIADHQVCDVHLSVTTIPHSKRQDAIAERDEEIRQLSEQLAAKEREAEAVREEDDEADSVATSATKVRHHAVQSSVV